MSRYIDEIFARENFQDVLAYMGSEVKRMLKKIPTADVEEVRHGEWYRHDKKKHGDTCYYCSVCEKMAMMDCMVWELTDYCPNCGADMRGEKNAQANASFRTQ